MSRKKARRTARRALIAKVAEVLSWQQPLSTQYAAILLLSAEDEE